MKVETLSTAGTLSLLVALIVLFPLSAVGDPRESKRAPEHTHQPVDVDTRPIISRIKVPLVHPRRLHVDSSGNILIADWGIGAVLRVTPDGNQDLVASGLNEPAGLAYDTAGNLYVSTHAQGMPGAGTVVRISPMGEESIFTSGLTGPTALAFNSHGDLFVANFHDNSISRITPDGEAMRFAENIPQPAALVHDDTGTLYVASSTEGTVFRLSTQGEITLLGSGFSVPSDLAIDPTGHLIVTNYTGTQLTYLDRSGRRQKYAAVPKGTIGLSFDHDGNLLLVNWDHPFLMKITQGITISCPHCGKRIPVRFRGNSGTRPQKPEGEDRMF